MAKVERISFEDEITKNKIKSVFLMGFVFVILVLLGFVISMIVDPFVISASDLSVNDTFIFADGSQVGRLFLRVDVIGVTAEGGNVWVCGLSTDPVNVGVFQMSTGTQVILVPSEVSF